MKTGFFCKVACLDLSKVSKTPHDVLRRCVACVMDARGIISSSVSIVNNSHWHCLCRVNTRDWKSLSLRGYKFTIGHFWRGSDGGGVRLENTYRVTRRIRVLDPQSEETKKRAFRMGRVWTFGRSLCLSVGSRSPGSSWFLENRHVSRTGCCGSGAASSSRPL